MGRPATTSRAETNGLLIEVQSRYVEEQSLPMAQRFVFAYTITITNHGSESVQLRSRHWIITDGLGEAEEVQGPGVVGEQPVLSPGEGFRYTSGAVLPTERGTMRGTYQMHRADGAQFDATIAPFLLERPHSLN
ncbi:MAG: Co2+/Mg2+ efflux protein ApaG [Deltaproteobacteria bacterium]|nr:Co2+/Mg2+ efflux protein ApaG [Deltaproteobacteria bacterium]MBW2404742.1 Co2+/Mg2+ efflux protein ApaG [Deltaproteobacteria bacterium]MBW2719114.1 Co2+/Mg2+ efflux protein ApaG [Deltaproteobacteria bacterium]RLB46571.1 MAG: Co2+/Mg2+ efflux protein ApaG [Deltaproteobacteria bacterium]